MTNDPAQIAQHDGIFVIFGITGDLAKRKLLPALYQLAKMNLFSDNFRILGTTRRQTAVEDVINDIESSLLANGEVVNVATLDKLRSIIEMVHMNISDQSDFEILKTALDSTEDKVGRCLNLLFYMAIPPQMFQPVVKGLGEFKLGNGCRHGRTESRLLIEKPFGHDTKSALELIKQMETVFHEQAIYRVDHYLAKETVQNILTFRFKNPIFQTAWDRNSIDHIMITASEAIGVESRANFYENNGALRDLIQSHLLQLMALTTMEEPENLSAAEIHAAKLTLLQAVTPISSKEVEKRAVRGQYDTYKKEVGNPASTTETFAALQLFIENDRWRDVPILLRTGKAMVEKVTEITLVFKVRGTNSPDRNMLTIRIQPNEGIVLSFLAKKPSLENESETVQMEFCYQDSFEAKQPDAYERVLVDAIRGDKTLFTTDEEVLASWRIIDSVLQAWSHNGTSLHTYPTGSWGPTQADNLAANCNASWLTGQLQVCPTK